MRRNKQIRKKRAGRGRVRWITVGLLMLGLAVGALAGFYIRNYVVNPRRERADKQKVSAGGETTPGGEESAELLPADSGRIQDIVGHLSQKIGVRVVGSDEEREAAKYLQGELEKLGYDVGWLEFTLPDGTVSQNLVTADPGSTDKYTFLVSGSIDSSSASPGANRNASGCAAVLELARVLKGSEHLTEVRFLLFGASEESGPRRIPGFFGSQNYLDSQPEIERAKIVGMISADEIAVGPEVHVRDWGSNSPELALSLIAVAKEAGIGAYENPSDGSDHRYFGMAGVPAVWLERRLEGGLEDSKAATAWDDASHISSSLVSEMVDLLSGYLLGLDEDFCEAAVSR